MGGGDSLPAADDMADVIVLCYHAVSPRWDADLSVTPEALDRQVGYLLARGWRATTFTDAVLGRTPGPSLAVTFDDAFASVARFAVPILARHRVPATVFAPTDFMDGGAQLAWPGTDQWRASPFADELDAMDWDGLRALADAGWEIGSHTCTHPRLTSLDDAALARELTESRERCSQELARPCRSIAYPYGDVDDRVATAAAAAGYEAGGKLAADLQEEGSLRFPRIGIYYPDGWPRFRLKVARPVRWLRASALTRGR